MLLVLQQKSEVVLYSLVQASHEFLEQLSGYPTVIVNGYPDSKRLDHFQSYYYKATADVQTRVVSCFVCRNNVL